MNLTINIKPEVRAELVRQAAAHGVDLGDYAANLLEEATQVTAGPRKLTLEQLDKALEEMAQFSEKIPSLPDEALSRESLYRDHD